MAQEEWSENAQLNAGRGLGKKEGVGPTYNTTGSSTSQSRSGRSGDDPRTAVGAAPSGQPTFESDLKPKGRGLKGVGFDDGAPNASFNNEIGGRNDPGRVAEQKFQRENAESGPDAGGAGPRQGALDKENLYNAVGESEA
jgi:hypothetical protein